MIAVYCISDCEFARDFSVCVSRYSANVLQLMVELRPTTSVESLVYCETVYIMLVMTVSNIRRTCHGKIVATATASFHNAS